MSAFYNENNPKIAAWLRELIKSDLIAPGIVDERSITEIEPDEIKEYRQCHFFAGVGGWSIALRLAGVSDEEEVWTGSCPCQPFSIAGKTETVGDERHLWPAFHRLISECRPAIAFGEQVSGKAGLEWLAGIRVDLEGSGYAVGASDLPAACVGAPHPRQRLFWVADTGHQRTGRTSRPGKAKSGRALGDASRCGEFSNSTGPCSYCGAGDHWRPDCPEIARLVRLGHTNERGLGAGIEQQVRLAESSSEHGRISDTTRERCGEAGPDSERCQERTAGTSERLGNAECSQRGAVDSAHGDDRRDVLPQREESPSGIGSAGEDGERLEHARSAGREERDGAAISVQSKLRRFANSGAWRDWEIIGFTDGKTRRIESGLVPLVDGLPKNLVRCGDLSLPLHAAEARQMRLHGYGNAIVPEVAAEFIKAYLETNL